MACLSAGFGEWVSMDEAMRAAGMGIGMVGAVCSVVPAGLIGFRAGLRGSGAEGAAASAAARTLLLEAAFVALAAVPLVGLGIMPTLWEWGPREAPGWSYVFVWGVYALANLGVGGALWRAALRDAGEPGTAG